LLGGIQAHPEELGELVVDGMFLKLRARQTGQRLRHRSRKRDHAFSSLCAAHLTSYKQSETYMLVHVEGVEDRDARLVGLDRWATVPAHLCRRVIGLQHHECVSDVG